MRAWLAIAFERSVIDRAIKMAVVVGTILGVIKHWDAIVSGHFTAKTLAQVGLTYLVPYCVSTFASVQAIRHLAANPRTNN
jgi:thiamine transporter ThiT